MSVRDEIGEPYLRGRKIIKRDGYDVILSDDMSSIPLCCPVCHIVLRSKLDEEEYNKNSCCAFCAKTFAYPNISKWKNGWRPDISEEERFDDRVVEFVFKID